jgi:hypothetical protein
MHHAAGLGVEIDEQAYACGDQERECTQQTTIGAPVDRQVVNIGCSQDLVGELQGIGAGRVEQHEIERVPSVQAQAWPPLPPLPELIKLHSIG